MNLNYICLICLSASFLLQAQRPAPLISPEVHPDRRVTFRLKAPRASEVTLTGDWLGAAPQPKLTKGDDGVWSVPGAVRTQHLHLLLHDGWYGHRRPHQSADEASRE